MLFQGTSSPLPQGWRVKKGEEGQERTRDSGVCRGNHTMRFLGVPRDEGCIWFSMATTCWSRGHTELLDPFIPRQGRSGVDSALSLNDCDGLPVSQSTHYGRSRSSGRFSKQSHLCSMSSNKIKNSLANIWGTDCASQPGYCLPQDNSEYRGLTWWYCPERL